VHFFIDSVVFLGFVVTKNWVHVDLRKSRSSKNGLFLKMLRILGVSMVLQVFVEGSFLASKLWLHPLMSLIKKMYLLYGVTNNNMLLMRLKFASLKPLF